MSEGTDSMLLSTVPSNIALINPSKLTIYRCKIPTVITETLIVSTRLYRIHSGHDGKLVYACELLLTL